MKIGVAAGGASSLVRVDVVIVDRRLTQDLPGSRAGGWHARTIEVLYQRGSADRFLRQGKVMQVPAFGMSGWDTGSDHGLNAALKTWC